MIDRLLEKEVVEAKEIDEILGLKPAEIKEEKKEETKPVAEPIKEEPKKQVKKKEDNPAEETGDLFGGQDA